jgi:3-oxoacyl-[acyl-carrier protein] reductase
MVYASDMSQALAGHGIRVNCITPGPVMTEDGPWAYIKDNMTPFYDSIMAQIPIGRMTTGEEMARAIVFVASPACKAMTGANLVVDGGFTKRVQF